MEDKEETRRVWRKAAAKRRWRDMRIKELEVKHNRALYLLKESIVELEEADKLIERLKAEIEFWKKPPLPSLRPLPYLNDRKSIMARLLERAEKFEVEDVD